MDESIAEVIKRALNALEHLRQAERKLPDTLKDAVEKVKKEVRKSDYGSAKVALVTVLESTPKPPEELWIALVDVLDALGETDIQPLLKYISRNDPKD